ncbi:hypothetical protein U472_11355 [Orenia metallireducens]|uniref:Aminoglycoside phosphotransferase domain-containing protein n=1 Tax=Orenia metallireducens TaxID=1413210 RepID=A0A1C0A8K3_9FIRM|nr:phosphotransferase [Orenia metallireducens]OCL26576.1 hypothetical protein U472_11355 [Orenia metallireducens]
MNKESLVTENWNLGKITFIKELDSFANKVYLITNEADENYILKEQNCPEKVEKENRLLALLEENLPVAAPLPTKEGKYYLAERDINYVCYPFLEGDSFANHYDGECIERANLLGQAIGELHYYLRMIELEEYEESNLIEDILKDVKNIVKQNKDAFDYDFF